MYNDTTTFCVQGAGSTYYDANKVLLNSADLWNGNCVETITNDNPKLDCPGTIRTFLSKGTGSGNNQTRVGPGATEGSVVDNCYILESGVSLCK